MTRKTELAIVALLLLLFLPPSHGKESLNAKPGRLPVYQPRLRPFEGGERTFYRGSWNGIPVATAELQSSSVWIDGKKYYQVQLQAKSSKFLDLFWKMRDTMTSVFAAETMRPHSFSFKQRENRRKVDTQAAFDPESEKWLVQRQKGRKLKHYEFESANILDPLTAVYLVRSLDFKVGDQLHFHLFAGKSRYLLSLNVVGKEQIELDFGVFEAFKITPTIKNITKSDDAQKVYEAAVWISADKDRVPLMVSGKAFIGSVYLELVSREHPKFGPTQL